MTGPRPARSTGRSAAAALRALLALAVLVALCVGIPLLLLALAPTSFRHGVPGPGDVFSALTERDDGTVFLAVLTLAAWAGWATFALAVLLELPAQLRGVPAVRLRGLGVQQSLAGGLVATVLAVVLVPGAASAPVRPAVRGTGAASGAAATAARVAGPAGTKRDAAHPAPAATALRPAEASSGPVHVVRPGDTLWDLAAEHLGDGARWRRIAALNYDREQPDGRHLDRSHRLQAGWRLELPAPQASDGAGTGVREHVVRPGETLSGIALTELGDATRYPELARATKEVRQPDGRHLTDPDLLYPGWRGEKAARARAPPPRPSSPPPA